MTLSCNLASAEVNFSYHKLSLMPSPAVGSTYISPSSPVYLSLPLSISFCALRKIFDFHFVLTHFKEEKLSSRQDKSVLCICKEPMCARVSRGCKNACCSDTYFCHLGLDYLNNSGVNIPSFFLPLIPIYFLSFFYLIILFG